MLIYYFNSFYALLSIGLTRKLYNKKKNQATRMIYRLAVIISFILAWLISTFRVVGRDRVNYSLGYQSISNMESVSSLPSNFESGFELYNFIISRISANELLLFSTTAFIILCFFYWFILKNSNYPEISLFLFFMMDFYIASWSLLRQYLAIGIIFYSLKYIKIKNFKNNIKFLALIIISSLFHTSALIFAPMILLTNRLNLKKIIAITLFGGIALVIITQNINIFKILGFVSPKYQSYQNTIYSEYGASPLHLVKQLLICIWVWVGIKKFEVGVKNSSFSNIRIDDFYDKYKYVNYTFISLAITTLSVVYVIFSRINIYFNVFAILLIPEMLALYKPKIRIIQVMLLIIISALYFYVIVNYTDSYSVIPYKTFLNQ